MEIRLFSRAAQTRSGAYARDILSREIFDVIVFFCRWRESFKILNEISSGDGGESWII